MPPIRGRRLSTTAICAPARAQWILDGDMAEGVRKIRAFGRLGNGRVEDLNAQRRADRFMNGGFAGTNDVGDLLGNGRKQRVVTLLDDYGANVKPRDDRASRDATIIDRTRMTVHALKNLPALLKGARVR